MAASATGLFRRWWKGFRPMGANTVAVMETLQVERAGGVVTITFDRPEKKNAVNGQMWDELITVAREISGEQQRPLRGPHRCRRRLLLRGGPLR